MAEERAGARAAGGCGVSGAGRADRRGASHGRGALTQGDGFREEGLRGRQPGSGPQALARGSGCLRGRPGVVCGWEPRRGPGRRCRGPARSGGGAGSGPGSAGTRAGPVGKSRLVPEARSRRLTRFRKGESEGGVLGTGFLGSRNVSEGREPTELFFLLVSGEGKVGRLPVRPTQNRLPAPPPALFDSRTVMRPPIT